MKKFFLVLVTLLFINTFACAEILKDDITDYLLQKNSVPQVHVDYNYEKLTKVPMKLRIINEIYSEKDIYEGYTKNYTPVKCYYCKENLIGKLVKVEIIDADVDNCIAKIL